MHTMEYKGYQGSIEIDLASGLLFGKLLFVNDLVTFEAKTVPALRKAFQEAVNDYLQTCRQLKRDPQQPCSGIFNVRVGPALHRAATIRAQQDGVKLNAVMVTALEQYLEGGTIKHAHTHDHNVTVKLVSLTEVKRPDQGAYRVGQTQQFEMNTTNATH
jgi:predicted HicB family RNase H-like nuclease